MKKYATQELMAGTVFFSACGWLVVDAVCSAPAQAPELWPLIPMFAATVWHVVIEHLRSIDRGGTI